MKLRSLVFSLLVCACALPGLALASGSPRRFLVDIKLSPYTPKIDDGYAAGTGPYQTVFNGKPMFMGEIEFDVSLWQRVGNITLGISAGYAEIYAKAFETKPDGTTVRSAESTGLQIVPVKLLLGYRVDFLYPWYRVPLTPYVKGGLVVMPWWSTKGGQVEVVNGTRGAGYKLGLAGTIGLALLLDFIDPQLALDMDTHTGVNHTALFAEFTFQEMKLFEFDKNAKQLNLSSWFWSFGISFEF